MTFLDTSGLLAFLDRDASQHDQVCAAMAETLRDGEAITHNYVLVETEALAHRRLDVHTALALDGDFTREGFELLPG